MVVSPGRRVDVSMDIRFFREPVESLLGSTSSAEMGVPKMVNVGTSVLKGMVGRHLALEIRSLSGVSPVSRISTTIGVVVSVKTPDVLHNSREQKQL